MKHEYIISIFVGPILLIVILAIIKYFLLPKPNKSSCYSNTECLSGSCVNGKCHMCAEDHDCPNGYNYCVFGTCQTGSVHSLCENNTDCLDSSCINNVCSHISDSTPIQTLYQNGYIFDWMPPLWKNMQCKDLDNSTTCNSDDSCTWLNSKCEERGCVKERDCKDLYCSGQKGYEFCSKQELYAPCNSNSDCQTGYCSLDGRNEGNVDLVENSPNIIGFCTNGKAGSMCMRNINCASERCQNFICEGDEKEEEEEEEILECPLGTYYNRYYKKCDKCPAGYYCPEGSIYKLECSPGTYSEEGQGECTECEEDWYTDIPASNSCLPCKEDYEADNVNVHTIEQCGYECPAGSVPDQFSCELCPAGTYEDEGECTECEAGTYSDEGATECTECQAGTYSYEEGATDCYVCSYNTYSEEGSTRCTDCIYHDECICPEEKEFSSTIGYCVVPDTAWSPPTDS